MSFTALRYTNAVDISNILVDVGDTINIFIKAELFTPEVIHNSNVYGSRPYSCKSDLISLCAHMGILFPAKKTKQNSIDILETSPNAANFGNNINMEEKRRIEDDFKFYGVLIAVTATKPLNEYKGCQGFYVYSKDSAESSKFSIDVLDYSFLSEFDPLPELVNNSKGLIYKAPKKDSLILTEQDRYLEYSYSPRYFKEGYESILFHDYAIYLICEGKKYYFMPITDTKFKLFVMSHTGDENDKIVEELLESEFNSLKFTDDGFTINGKQYENVIKIRISEKEKIPY